MVNSVSKLVGEQHLPLMVSMNICSADTTFCRHSHRQRQRWGSRKVSVLDISSMSQGHAFWALQPWSQEPDACVLTQESLACCSPWGHKESDTT